MTFDSYSLCYICYVEVNSEMSSRTKLTTSVLMFLRARPFCVDYLYSGVAFGKYTIEEMM